MAKGKAKTKYDYTEEKCNHSAQGGWCNLPKGKRCYDVIRNIDNSKACAVKL